MSTSERDTRFQGFAKLVIHQVYANGPQTIDVYERIIARSAYDLVFYLLKNSDDLALDMGGYRDKPDDYTVYTHIKMLPDIPEFPTTSPADVFWEEEVLATDLSEYDAGEEYDSEH